MIETGVTVLIWLGVVFMTLIIITTAYAIIMKLREGYDR